MYKMFSWVKHIQQFFKPKVGSDKWLRTAPLETVWAYREELWNKLMDPKEDLDLRWRIRDYTLPYIERIIRSREK